MLEVSYLGDYRTKAEHGKSGTVVCTDSSTFSPIDLLALSLGSCVLTVMGMKSRSMGLDFSGAKVQLEKTLSRGALVSIDSIHVLFHYPEPLDPEVQKTLEKAARSCPVHRSLEATVSIEYTFLWGST